MAFDGNGNYVVPVGTGAVVGTLIDAAPYNALLADLQTALTKCLLRDGQSAAQANISMGGFRFSNLAAGISNGDSARFEQLYALPKGSYTPVRTVAYAATLAIDASLSNAFEIGTLTGNVTSLTIANPVGGQKINLRFVQDATGSRTVALPAGSNITSAPNLVPLQVSNLTIMYSTAGARWEGAWDNWLSGVSIAPDEWVLFNAAPTYVSPTVFTVAGDQTNIFQVRRRLKSTNTGGTVYGTIVSAVFAASATTVTVSNTLGVLDAGLSAVSYGLLAANNSSIPASLPGSGIQPITASIAANALTVTVNPATLDFRSATLGSGAITSRTLATLASLIVPSTATLGTINAVQSRIVVLLLDNAGTLEPAVVNIAGGNDLTETGVISTTAISAAANSANVIYSTTARAGVAYRVVGYVQSTQATAGTWATAPSTIQGVGGQALAAMSSIGYAQTWQEMSGSRVPGTTYYNTTGRPILVSATLRSTAAASTANATLNGATINGTSVGVSGFDSALFFIVPPGGSYSANTAATASIGGWAELR